MTTEKKIANALAKALNEIDIADWHARDWRLMQRQLRPLRDKLSRLFTSTGYEYAEKGTRTRVRRT
jgi:hypothetical protein